MILIIANLVTALALGALYWAIHGIGPEFALGLWVGAALGIWACRNPENPFTTPLNAEKHPPE